MSKVRDVHDKLTLAKKQLGFSFANLGKGLSAFDKYDYGKTEEDKESHRIVIEAYRAIIASTRTCIGEFLREYKKPEEKEEEKEDKWTEQEQQSRFALIKGNVDAMDQQELRHLVEYVSEMVEDDVEGESQKHAVAPASATTSVSALDNGAPPTQATVNGAPVTVPVNSAPVTVPVNCAPASAPVKGAPKTVP